MRNDAVLNAHGHSAVDWLIENEFVHMDAAQFKIQLRRFYRHVHEPVFYAFALLCLPVKFGFSAYQNLAFDAHHAHYAGPLRSE